MNRSSSMGLLVFGIVLGVVGAILRYAVEVTPDGFDIHAAGVIMLVVGWRPPSWHWPCSPSAAVAGAP